MCDPTGLVITTVFALIRCDPNRLVITDAIAVAESGPTHNQLDMSCPTAKMTGSSKAATNNDNDNSNRRRAR